MGKNIKRLSLALFALGLSAPVFAYCDSPFCVTIPNQQGGFTVGADALLLRPTSAATGYAEDVGPLSRFETGLAPTPVAITESQSFSEKANNGRYDWGFDITAAYRLPCTGNDISATWIHLNQNDDRNRSVFDPKSIVSYEVGVPQDFADGDNVSGFWDQGSSRIRYRYDAVDLDVGQRVNFGCRFLFHVIAGVRWADLDQKRNSDFNVTGAQTSTTVVGPAIDPTTGGFAINAISTGSFNESTAIRDESEFRGVGPQVGFDGRYCIGYGFGFDAGATLSLLVGRTDIKRDTFTVQQSFTTTGVPESLLTLNTHTSVDRRDRVVPAADVNLGLDYTYNFNNCSRSSLVIQAGYKVIHYWGVSQFASSGAAANLGTNDIGHLNTERSVSFDGPYAGIKVNV